MIKLKINSFFNNNKLNFDYKLYSESLDRAVFDIESYFKEHIEFMKSSGGYDFDDDCLYVIELLFENKNLVESVMYLIIIQHLSKDETFIYHDYAKQAYSHILNNLDIKLSLDIDSDDYDSYDFFDNKAIKKIIEIHYNLVVFIYHDLIFESKTSFYILFINKVETLKVRLLRV